MEVAYLSEITVPRNEPADSTSAASVRGPRRWQVRLHTAFLLVAAIGVWMAYFVNRRHNSTIQARIHVLAPLAHELEIDDPKKIAVVKMEEYWMGDNRWELYLPDGPRRLCLATRGISDKGFPDAPKAAPLAAGRHIIMLDPGKHDNGWRVRVLCDDKEVLSVDEPKEWNPDSGSTSVGQSSPSEQLPPENPVVLLRCRFTRRKDAFSMFEPAAEGTLLWIERVASAGKAP
jgi:hypothetical protein